MPDKAETGIAKAEKLTKRQRRVQMRAVEGECLSMWLGGHVFEFIAAQVGYKDESGARRAARRALARVEIGDNETEVKADLERLRRMLLGVWDKAIQGELGPLDRVIKILERRAKMLGLDAPVKAEVSGPGGRPIALEHRGTDVLEKLRQMVEAKEREGANAKDQD